MPRIRPPVLSTKALPATLIALQAQCVVKIQPSLVDEIVKIFFALYEDPEFRALRGEDDPESTVHGSIQDDDTVSAEMVKEKGIEMGMQLVRVANLHQIRLKLRVAERRYNAARSQRKNANVRNNGARAAATEETAD